MMRLLNTLLINLSAHGWQQVGQAARELADLSQPLAEGYCRLMTPADDDYEQECSRA